MKTHAQQHESAAPPQTAALQSVAQSVAGAATAQGQAGAPPVDGSNVGSTAVTVTKDPNAGLPALSGLDAVMGDIMKAAEQGGEKFTAAEVAIPFLTVLQSSSPQVKEGEPGYIEGAKAGMFINSVTNELVDARCFAGKAEPTGLPVVFAAQRRMLVEWMPERGGFVAQHLPDSPVVQNAKPTKVENKSRPVLKTAGGNELTDTEYFHPIIVGEYLSWAVMGFVSTQLTKARKLNTFVSNLVVSAPDKSGNKIKPLFPMLAFRIKTVPESNDRGSWWGLKIEYAGPIWDAFPDRVEEIYRAATAYREAVMSGAAGFGAPPVENAEQEVPF